MQPIPQPTITPGPQYIDLAAINNAGREKVSGAAIRTFVNICNALNLSEKEKINLLGGPGRSTYHSWVSKAEKGQAIILPLDTLLRISAILGIYKAINIIFSAPEQGIKWLKSPNSGISFGGLSPLAIMLSGTQDGIMQIRRYLDAWRGGVFASPLLNDTRGAINPDDIIIVK